MHEEDVLCMSCGPVVVGVDRMPFVAHSVHVGGSSVFPLLQRPAQMPSSDPHPEMRAVSKWSG